MTISIEVPLGGTIVDVRERHPLTADDPVQDTDSREVFVSIEFVPVVGTPTLGSGYQVEYDAIGTATTTAVNVASIAPSVTTEGDSSTISFSFPIKKTLSTTVAISYKARALVMIGDGGDVSINQLSVVGKRPFSNGQITVVVTGATVDTMDNPPDAIPNFITDHVMSTDEDWFFPPGSSAPAPTLGDIAVIPQITRKDRPFDATSIIIPVTHFWGSNDDALLTTSHVDIALVLL